MLVVAEVALALVLLTGAALMIRTFRRPALASTPGFNPHNVLTLETSLAAGQLRRPPRKVG